MKESFSMLWQLANSLVILLLMVFCVVFWLNARKANSRLQSSEAECLQLKIDLEQFKQESVKSNVHSQQSVVNLKKQQQELLQHLEQVISSVSTIAKQSSEFALELEQTKDQVHILKSESSEQRLYGRAKKMIEMGADIGELVSECEIPRAEAELLMSLYKK